MKGQQITNIRKAVCIMANELKKLGYSLSAAFKKAWSRIKNSMTVRATGVSFGNRQEILQFIAKFKREDLYITLEREQANIIDCNAIRVIVHIKPLQKKAFIGYIPKGISNELAKVIDKGLSVKADLLGVIGGYAYKENYGALLNIAI